MKYFYYSGINELAIQQWYNSQFDLCDIVLSLTDNHILIGARIYAIFCRPEVLNMMQYFVCDFAKIKSDLGIIGSYVERDGNIYSKCFNPIRNKEALTLTIKEIKIRAREVYKNIMSDLSAIAKSRLSNIKYKE
jgi:hypothetical protein